MAANVKNLPLSVIFAAKSGDGQALGAVLNHYQRYIRSLATRTLTDECGAEALAAAQHQRDHEHSGDGLEAFFQSPDVCRIWQTKGLGTGHFRQRTTQQRRWICRTE